MYDEEYYRQQSNEIRKVRNMTMSQGLENKDTFPTFSATMKPC